MISLQKTTLVILIVVLLATAIINQGCQDNIVKIQTGWELVKIKSLDIPEPSGIVYDISTNSLLIVCDRTGLVYRTNTNGDLQETIQYEGVDPEGIAITPDGQTFFVVEEQDDAINVIDPAGVIQSTINISNYVSEYNKGFEGIVYVASENVFYLAHEKEPVSVVKVDMAGAVLQRYPFLNSDDLSGITINESTDEILLLSDESKKILHVDENFELIESWDIEIIKAEGITTKGDTLYIVSDQESELYTFVRIDSGN